MIFSWLAARRRRAIRSRPFPSEWEDSLQRNCRQASWLSAAEGRRLREWIAVFLAEKRFEGCGGQTIDDSVRLSIAGQAGLVVLGFPEEYFDRLKSVLVYPGDWVGRKVTALEGGATLEWRERRLGEAWSGGSVVLSWPAVRRGGRLQDGARSVVIHEFAHLVDAMNGPFDGLPPLPRGIDARDWATRLSGCRERYEEALDEGRFVALDDYAADSPVEFFAVASECFFQDPHRLARQDADLYNLLAASWQQDPKSRVPLSALRGR
ncbi:MAG: hypothetical protein DWH79_05115 [Planctomycetota bacterium]|nr:MAG: hypothetical protein DWH79_05115 [Planctomycetota bacterium]